MNIGLGPSLIQLRPLSPAERASVCRNVFSWESCPGVCSAGRERLQAKIRRGLPDVLDLMVICIEAGQSLDQATIRTAEELRTAQPAISDELGVVVLEQRAGRERTAAWRQFAERTAVDTVRNLVSVLVQSEKFGTSIAKTLRVHADTLRTQRRQKVEEQAAKTSVKLVFPLVFFIFPALFVVTLGPAIIVIQESFKTLLTH